MLQKGFDQFAKLTCRWRYGQLLSAYLDRELDAHRQKVMAGHLRDCAGCRVELEQMRFANRALVEFEIPRGPLKGGLVFPPPTRKAVAPVRKLYARTIAVPLPLAAGVLIALVSATLFTISRNQRTPEPILIPSPSSAAVKVVEVPVERVVIRTVYSRRSDSQRVRRSRKGNDFNLTPPDLKEDLAQNTDKVEWSDSTLKNFRPAASANLRVVKEHEK
jgi:Putative zinc-finger